MIKNFFSAWRTPQAAPAAVPDGERVYAIGDIHGRLDLLDMLIDRIDADDAARGAARTSLVFLGDLIDRGPDSCGVVERVRALSVARGNVRVLLGNHEEVFLLALSGDAPALRTFTRIGGRETIISYGIDRESYDAMGYAELYDAFRARVPDAHIAFVESCEDVIAIGDYALVHAGIRPGTPLLDQTTGDLRWIREPFLSHRGSLEKKVVHGHTISDSVKLMAHRIGIDTGAYRTGRLTALGLEGTDTWQLEALLPAA